LYAHVEGVKKEVYQLSTEVLNSDYNEVPFNQLKEKLQTPLLDIHFERAETLKPREVSKEYNVPTGRFASVRKAIEIEIRVAFDGDPSLFKYTPSKYTLCLPRGGIDECNNELILIFLGLNLIMLVIKMLVLWVRALSQCFGKARGPY
jgi:hypothetical protein